MRTKGDLHIGVAVTAVAAFAAVFAAGAADLITAREATNIAEYVVHASVDGAARPLPKYLHALDFSDGYPDAAAEYYRSRGNGKVDGGCSSVRDGGFLCRNFDYPFDDRAEFVVKMSAGKDRFASVGVAQVGTNLTERMVTSGKPEYSRLYKWLPGATVDGINENGVACNINVVGGDPQTSGWHNDTGDLNPLAAIRWILDNATNSQSAAEHIASHIAFPQGWTQNFHWMIADERETWIVENGTASNVTAVAAKRVMTNFPILPDAYTGIGEERYALLRGGESITNVWYTRAYLRSTTPYWYSEFNSDDFWYVAVTEWAKKPKEEHRGESFDGESWWQSVHTSIYDITNRVLRICVQETDDWYTFAVPSASSPTGVDEGKVREIVSPIIGAATNGLRRVDDMAVYERKWQWYSDSEEYASRLMEFRTAPDVQVSYLPYFDRSIGKWDLPSHSAEFGSISEVWTSGNGNDQYAEKLETFYVPYGTTITNVLIYKLVLVPGSERLATTNGVNAAIERKTYNLRTIGDENVYAPGTMGPFSYRNGSPSGVIQALGSKQPYEYGYGSGECEYDIYFTYDGFDINAYAYGHTTDETLQFNGYGYKWNYDTGEEEYIDVSFEGYREAGSWTRTEAKFAHDSDLVTIRTSINTLNGYIGGETKVMREGGEFEYGTGWGYLKHSIVNETRTWRIRVPLWSSVANTNRNETTSYSYYFTRTNGTPQYIREKSGSRTLSAVLYGIMTWTQNWGLERKLVETRGIYGTDGTQYADYRLGLVFRDDENRQSPAISYDVVQTAYSPMSFSVTPDTTGLIPVTCVAPVPDSSSTATLKTLYMRALDVPQVTRTWSVSAAYTYTTTMTADIKGVLVEPGAVTSANGTFMLRFWTLCDCTWTFTGGSASYKPDTITADDVVLPWDVTVTANSYSTMEDLILPAYRLVTTLDANLFYDTILDATMKISVSNGLFFSEKVIDGDWRTK